MITLGKTTFQLPTLLLMSWITLGEPPASAAPSPYLSPSALAAAADGRTLYIGCATADRVLVLDTATRKCTDTIALPASPTGLILSADGTQLIVTCGAPQSTVCLVDVAQRKVSAKLTAGHTAQGPALSRDGQRLFVCNRFNNSVSFFDLASRTETRRVKVRREPVAAALTLDGRFLLVANHLSDGPADADEVAAVVSVIDTGTGQVAKELHLPQGSESLQDIRVSPDGKFAIVTHVLSRFHLPTTQLDRGWMNTNAGTLIDLERMEVLNTILLDNVDRGAANPWGTAWSADGRTLIIAHAGTHEISVIDFPALLAKLLKLPRASATGTSADYTSASRPPVEASNDLAFLTGIRRRLKLPTGLFGPRAVVLLGNRVYTANYFSDNLGTTEISLEYPRWESVALGTTAERGGAAKGEFYFNDASICFQGWQSCATCHPGDARVDALNWDLTNDGIGNPKNTKSLLLSHQTPPAMSMGVRETAEQAVRAGIRHILFTEQPEAVALAIDEYLKSLKSTPSPHLEKGRFSAAAARGKKLFENTKVGCSGCHPAPLFTALQSCDVGTLGRYDHSGERFDTPTLVEVWRTAPYLHDGSAATIRDVLTSRNRGDQHGVTSHLTPQQLDDLATYVLSL
jgi:YVTN family beta-propeller protein